MTRKQGFRFSRRSFVKTLSGGMLATSLSPVPRFLRGQENGGSDIFHIHDIPEKPFLKTGNGNHHAGLESLLQLMGQQGLKFYRSDRQSALSGPRGLIAPDDVVLIKVNAQWKHRGCTNSDLIRGLIQRILDHPDGFSGEAVIFENGQGRGSLNCDTEKAYGNRGAYANANNPSHTFLYLINEHFDDPRVSGYLLDPIRERFITEDDHTTDGYRKFENVSYPCFTTDGGNRVELKDGVWAGKTHSANLKLINVPVIKHHDTRGSEITAALKHFYGVLSMKDGWVSPRHYNILGETCGKMVQSVCTPVLNIMDAIWVSHRSIKGYPEHTTFRANQIAASQDPVALDYWSAKHILYPIDNNPRHHPDFLGNHKWLEQSKTTINSRGGLRDPRKGILVNKVTRSENQMRVFSENTQTHVIRGNITWDGASPSGGLAGVTLRGLPGDPITENDGRYQVRVIPGWSGMVIPEKQGFTFVPEKREYRNILKNQIKQNYQGLQGLAAPKNLTGKRITNRGLFVREHIVELRWETNPLNAGRGIETYRIYDTSGYSSRFLAELGADTRSYLVRNLLDEQPRTFQVVAVDRSGREGPPASLTV
jgi:hypothetical protein